MKLYLLTEENGHVYGYDESGLMGEEYEVPDTFIENFSPRYKIVNNQIVEMSCEEFELLYPDLYVDPKKEEQEKLFKETQQDLLLQYLPDEQAIQFNMLYPEWVVGHEYRVDYTVRYGEDLYRCLQNHISTTDSSPLNDLSETYWKRLS